MNVAATCDLYITAKAAKCRQNTLDGYISAIRCHVLPKWGERELSDIRRKEVQEWVDPGTDPDHPSGLYAIIDGTMWCDLYLGR